MKSQESSRSCEQCGNSYDKPLKIVEADGTTHEFDCFECAIQRMAPQCGQCQVRVIGHGVQAGAKTFCCAHCASQAGVEGLVDRLEHPRGAA